MKILITFLLIIVTLTTNAKEFQTSIPDDYGFKIELGQTVPDFVIELPDGSQRSMLDLRGKVVMLQFTASWCSVCRKEMPHIEKDIWLKHKNKPNFALYGIDLKEDVETVKNFQSQVKVTYPIALDLKGDIFDLFTQKNAGVTRNIIIDKDGRIVYVTRLFKQAEFEEMLELIDALLAE